MQGMAKDMALLVLFVFCWLALPANAEESKIQVYAVSKVEAEVFNQTQDLADALVVQALESCQKVSVNLDKTKSQHKTRHKVVGLKGLECFNQQRI